MQEGTDVVFRDSATNPAAGWVGKAVGTVLARREIPGLKQASFDISFEIEGRSALVEGIPESQLITAHDFEREEIRASTGGMDPDNLLDLLEKAGVRHGASDRQHIQKCHDHLAACVDGAHCDGVNKAAIVAGLEKKGSKWQAGDVVRIGQAHDLCKALGAKCNSTVQKD